MMWIECTTEQDAQLQDPRITPWLDTLTACTLVLNVLVTSACSPLCGGARGAHPSQR